jgi:hypothetical protein
MDTKIVENKSLFQGNNEFETGLLTVPAEGSVPLGALLKRAAGKFSVAVDAETPVAINPVEVKNPSDAPVDIPFRALISGRVRRDMLKFNGGTITDAQTDQLRQYGIIPKKATDLSWTE